jgi:hypothetical protein
VQLPKDASNPPDLWIDGGDKAVPLFLGGGYDLAVILKAFCDETCTHAGAPLTCVGGYIFDEKGERMFSKEWVEIFKPFKDRGIDCFHANKCYKRTGQFSALTDDSERDFLFNSLIALTLKTAKLGIVSGIEDKVFKAVMERNKFQTFTGSKYTVCTLRSLSLIEQWANENKFDGKVIYLFESGNEHQGEADEMMGIISKDKKLRADFRYENHDFIKKSLLPPLQAADMFVWLFQKWSAEGTPTAFLNSLLNDRRFPHIYQPISDLSLNMLALLNMTHGVKSKRKYESQTGKVKHYHF